MCLNSTYCVFKVPGRVSLLHCAISQLVIVLTRSWTQGNFIVTSGAELLCFGIVAKFIMIIVSAWASRWVTDCLFSPCLIFKLPSWAALPDDTVCTFMLIFTWTRANRDLLFPSNAEDLGFRVVTKLIRMIISAWTTLRVSNSIFTACVVQPLPSWAALSYKPLCTFMFIITRTWANRYLLFASDAENLAIRVVTKFVVVVIGAWTSRWISYCVFSASLIVEIPSWITLACCSISVLMLVLSWARSI